MNNCIDSVNIESAVVKANFSGLDLLVMQDDFEILDLLRSIKQFKSSYPVRKCGLDAIRDLDKIPSDTTAYMLFQEKNVYFVLIKFTNINNDGGLALIYSTKKAALIKLFKTSATMLSNTGEIIKWLDNSN